MFLVEMYDAQGVKVYNFRQKTAPAALEELAQLAAKDDLYPFVTATCYLNSQVVWEFEVKSTPIGS